MKLLIINGPNLNLLGKREKNIYGNISFEDYLIKLRKKYLTTDLSYYQSNIEGEIVSTLQLAQVNKIEGIILNAAGYTHTSVAIADAIAALALPVVEVHISQILMRESFRHVSLLAPHCVGSIFGFGLKSYDLAIIFFNKIGIRKIKNAYK